MGTINVTNLGKAYKQYPTRWSRLAEWVAPSRKVRHKLTWVLRGIDFHMEPGEAVGLIGVNGSGKSTLLKVITGTTQPTTGSVKVVGQLSALLELGMGFHPDFTGRQNVFMAGQLIGLSTEQISTLMSEIEQFAEIGDYIDQPVRIYSSGMQVRLAFAIATARRPDILIIDEALSVGDAYFQHKSFSRIREFQRLGTTLLLVSHDMASIRAICNKALWLEAGEVREYAETKQVVDAYTKALYEKQQVISASSKNTAENTPSQALPTPVKIRDCRLDFLNNSNLRNDIEVLVLDPHSNKWGDGAATIDYVRVQDENNSELSWIIGGEDVVVVVSATSLMDLENVFIGFQVCDRLGQILFGDSSFYSTYDNPVSLAAGLTIIAKFKFNMPFLPYGTYKLQAAIASGTQKEHIVHDWTVDSVFFESHNQNGVNGLVGIPIQQISLSVNDLSE